MEELHYEIVTMALILHTRVLRSIIIARIEGISNPKDTHVESNFLRLYFSFFISSKNYTF